LHAIAFTRGPGLLGSLLVGTSFAKSFSLGLDIPLIEVDHLEAHVMSHFIERKNEQKKSPSFPFLCLTVSGGHTQIVKVDSFHEMKIIGQTIDDAAGEAYDKAAKIMGLPYPGGPMINKLAQNGNSGSFSFPKPRIKGLDFSFSGLKTSFLYFLRDELKKDETFIETNKNDLSASIQHTINEILIEKLSLASKQTGINEIALAGGVSANTDLRQKLLKKGAALNWNTYLPEFEYSTDNAAMIAIVGYIKYLNNDFTSRDISPYSRSSK